MSNACEYWTCPIRVKVTVFVLSSMQYNLKLDHIHGINTVCWGSSRDVYNIYAEDLEDLAKKTCNFDRPLNNILKGCMHAVCLLNIKSHMIWMMKLQ